MFVASASFSPPVQELACLINSENPRRRTLWRKRVDVRTEHEFSHIIFYNLAQAKQIIAFPDFSTGPWLEDEPCKIPLVEKMALGFR